GARRQVGVVMNLKTLLDTELGQDAAHRRMLNLGRIAHQLHLGVNDAGAMLEERWQSPRADIAIFVDRGSDHCPAMLAEPVRIIGAAAEQRKTEWRAADDHVCRPWLMLSPNPPLPRTLSASASVSGVPISMNLKHPAKAASDSAGNLSNTSRSIELALPAAISSSKAAERK